MVVNSPCQNYLLSSQSWSQHSCWICFPSFFLVLGVLPNVLVSNKFLILCAHWQWYILLPKLCKPFRITSLKCDFTGTCGALKKHSANKQFVFLTPGHSLELDYISFLVNWAWKYTKIKEHNFLRQCLPIPYFCNIGSPLAGSNIIKDINPLLYCPALTVLRVPHLQVTRAAWAGMSLQWLTLAATSALHYPQSIPERQKPPWSFSRLLVCAATERAVIKNLGHKGLWRFALLGMQI